MQTINHPVTPRRKFRGLVVTLGACLALVACGSKDDDQAKQDMPKSEQETSVSETATGHFAEQQLFLADNAQKEGWVITDSELQYKVIESGEGKSPKPQDYVKVDYKLTLTDGTVVDSSYDRGEPAIFPAGRLIQGWVEALGLMKEGDKWQLVVPPKLGYGDQGRPGLPANSVLLFDVELHEVMTEEDLRAESERLMKEYAAKQEAYLEENAKKDGVTITESGLQYEIIESGDAAGVSPTAEQQVEVHYRGQLTDGTEFDSSYKRGQTATFPLGGVISGWTEVLQLMKPGDKWLVTLPQQLGYGEYGSGRNIPPYSTLVFEIELIRVVTE